MTEPEQTLIIRHEEIAQLLDIPAAIAAVEKVFSLYSAGDTQMPPKNYIYFAKGDLRCMPAYVPELGLASVKNVTVHPGNQKHPSVMATITLLDPQNGFPLAIMDGTLITAYRTAAAAAVATRYLAPEGATRLGFVGAGAQAFTQVEALLAVRPDTKSITLFDRNKAKAENAARVWAEKYGVDVSVSDNVESVVSHSDVLTTTTPSQQSFVELSHIRQGLHINAMGADARGKQEIANEVMQCAGIIIDNWEQASHSGEINVPLAAGLLTREDIRGDIGEVVTGKINGRTSSTEITVFDSTGLAIQDLACAERVYSALTQKPDLLKQVQRISF